MSVRLESPYDVPGTLWLRGNLHTHCTRSDGQGTAQEMVNTYAHLGYDFLSLSDHDVLSDYNGVDPCGMILIAGNEISGGPHVLDVGARTLVGADPNHQLTLDGINSRSGFPVLCHPSWELDFNHYPYEKLHALQGYVGIEIFNGTVIEQAGSNLATDKWDRLLATGRRVWGYANDDAHRVGSAGRGWNVVKVAQRTPEAILAALRAGAFYASSGVRIERIECDGPNLIIVAPDADRIAVFGQYGKRETVVDGAELRFDVSRMSGQFVRVECYGRGGDMAWTQPLVIRGGIHERMAGGANSKGRAVLKAYRADRAPALSGRVDDPLWQKAQPFDAFILLDDGSPAPVKTEVRCIIGGGKLTFALRCDEPYMDRIKAALPGARMWNADSVEIFIDAEAKAQSACQIVVNTAGESFAGWRGPQTSQAPATTAKAGRYDQNGVSGWSAELSINLADLKADSDAGTRWGLHICRNRYPQRATYVWSWVGHSNHSKEMYGSLEL